MAMMAKMRSLAPAFIITVGVLFVLFMVISDSKLGEIFGRQSQILGEVNGEEITYQEYQNLLDQAREIQKAQTGTDVEEEFMDQFNDQVWETVVNQKLIQEQIDEFGLKVSDEEVADEIFGPAPPDFLRRQFIDSTGRFNRALYENTLRNQDQQIKLAIEEQVRQQLLNEKLQSYLSASLAVSEAELQNRFKEENIRMNAEYVVVDVNAISDSGIAVSESDLKNYYDNNLDRFKVVPQRKIKYVFFSRAATGEDTTRVVKTLQNVYDRLSKDTSSFASYSDIYSEVPYSIDTLTADQLSPEAVSALANAQTGSVVGPVQSFGGYAIYKLRAKVSGNETFARASHILVPLNNNDQAALEQANKLYEELTSGGADFAKVAKERSTDFGSARRGGDLGWFRKGQMVPEFEKAVFEGKVGDIQKPIKTNYGYHIVKVTGKTSDKFVVESIVNAVKASATTSDRAFQTANDFAYMADKEGFESQAQGMGYKIQESLPFTKEANSVPGIPGTKNLVSFAFDNDLNDVGDVFKTPTGYVVAKVSEITKAGFKQFDEVKENLRPQVIREKKFEKAQQIAAQIKQQAQNGNSLQQAASRFPSATYHNENSFTVSQGVQNLGRDYAFGKTALETSVNKISDPVKGLKGYYLVKVNERTNFDENAYKIQRNTLRDNMLQQKRQTMFNQWLAQIRKEADIKDYRWKFFR